MKTPIQLLSILFAASTACAATQNVLTIAVFDFASPDEAVRNLGPKISTLINANLSADPDIITVERTDLQKALGEQELGLSGTVTPDSAAKVGQLTGAKVLVTGRVFQVENQLMIVAKIIGTETSRVYGEMVSGRSGDSIADLSAALAGKIAADIDKKGDTLVAKVESRDERLAKLKEVVAGKKLPVVSVTIHERHFGQPVIDPAAQTELSFILQKCGFKLLDSSSTNKAEIEISGDAFSAYGMRKGNLISCKSRVEITARDADTGNPIVVDRQTSVGIDVAEQSAAKTALENAVDQLAVRLIPRLAR